MLTILVDENIDGYKDYLSRFVFSSGWSDINSTLGVRIVDFEEVGLAKAETDSRFVIFACERYYVRRVRGRPLHLWPCTPHPKLVMVDLDVQP